MPFLLNRSTKKCSVSACNVMIGEGCECEFDASTMSREVRIRYFDGTCCVCSYKNGKFNSFFNYSCDNCLSRQTIINTKININKTMITDIENEFTMRKRSMSEGDVMSHLKPPDIVFLITDMSTHFKNPCLGSSFYVGNAIEIMNQYPQLYHANIHNYTMPVPLSSLCGI
jgi:hypothetical protein